MHADKDIMPTRTQTMPSATVSDILAEAWLAANPVPSPEKKLLIERNLGGACGNSRDLIPEFSMISPSDDYSDEDDVTTLKAQLDKLASKQDRRREQNKQAARRARKRVKERTQELTKETQQLSSSNTALRQEIELLSAQKAELLQQLQEHFLVCQSHTQTGYALQ